ncbi:MAG: phosphatase PAP2 family protein [Ilumatobacteraceae bacterium]
MAIDVCAAESLDSHADESDAGPAQGPVHGRPKRFGWVREAAMVLVFYYVYQTIRSFANSGNVSPRAFSNANRLVSVERHMHIYSEQRIQEALLSARWFIKFLNVYYGTLHFVITAGLLIWVYHFRHAAYRRMRNLLGITTGLALIGYWAFPLAPPRLLKWDHFVDTLDTIGGLWSYNSPVAKAVANPFAAMPSLHFGWALWCGIVFYTLTTHKATRAMILVYPFLTLTAIVVTANHYFLDAAGGAVLVVTAVLIQRSFERWQERRHSSSSSSSEASVPVGPAMDGSARSGASAEELGRVSSS